jgi:hypothetical protein
VYHAGFRFSPSFYDGHKVWLGGVIGWQGLPMLFRPDLALLARQHFVEDAGDNLDLKNVDSYFGLGFDTKLSIYLGDKSGGVLSKLVANVGYRYEYNSDNVVDIKRMSAGLSYEISSNTTAEVTYVKGRDPNTLQQEDKLTAGVTVKY